MIVNSPRGRNSLVLFILLMVVAVLVYQFRSGATQPERIPLNEVASKVKTGEIVRIVVDENELELVFNDGTKALSRKEPTKTTVEQLKDLGVTEQDLNAQQIALEIKEPSDLGTILSLVTYIFPALLVVGLIWLWGFIVKGITFIVSLFPQPDFTPQEALPGAMTTPVQEPDYSKFLVLPEVVRKGLRFGWSILMIGFVLAFFWRISEQIFTWLRARFGTSGNAEYESLSGAFWTDIKSLFQCIFHWLLKILKWPARLRKQKKVEPKEITSIRQLYQQLLRWAAKGGLPRPAFQTAYEYLDVLQAKLPAYQHMLQYVTRKYVSARYGHATPSAAELEQLKQNWQQLRHQHLK